VQALGVTSVSLLAIQSRADFSVTFLIGLLKALIPALCMNVYIVGLNQIYDIEIDKVNKPYLPLASGEYSLATGIAIVVTFAAVSLAIGVYVGSRPLMWALTVSLVLGTAYSVDVWDCFLFLEPECT
jgi:homogentisate phytyltransferase/homogentisate geranylgeranyltransferase